MSDWHFGMDYDMWLYPPVDWMAPDYDYELPEPIEAANIEGTLLVNAEDAIEQVHCLQTENAKLRELAVLNWEWAHSCCGNNCKMQTDGCGYQIDRECNYEREIWDRMGELGVEVDG